MAQSPFVPADVPASHVVHRAMRGGLRSPNNDAATRGRLNATFFEALRSEPEYPCLAAGKVACSKIPIASHTLAKAAVLRRLADQGGHVMMLRLLAKGSGASTEAVTVGVNQATTFPGLCAHHDASLFREVDDPMRGAFTKRHQFLFAYRALLRQLTQEYRDAHRFRLLEGRGAQDDQRDEVSRRVLTQLADWGVNNYDISRRQKAEMDDRLRGDTIGREWTFFRRELPALSFAGAVAFTPARLMEKAAPGATFRRPDLVLLTVVPTATRSLVFVAIPPHSKRRAMPYVRDLLHGGDDAVTAAIWRALVGGSEYFVIRPAAWLGLGRSEQEEVLEYFSATHHLDDFEHMRLPVPRS